MMEKLFTRDNVTWALLCLSGLGVFLLTSTTALVPDAAKPYVKDVSAVLAFIAAWFRKSPLPHSDSL